VEPGFEAMYWSSENGMQGIGDLPGAQFESGAEAVSGDGLVIVGTGNAPLQGDDYPEAFRWTSGTGMQGLGDLLGYEYGSYARAISHDGSVIAGSGNDSNIKGEAYRWTLEGGVERLGDLPGGQFKSHAFGISADGSIVVGAGTISADGRSKEAFRWTSETGMIGLGDLPGGESFSYAYAVNGSGSLVVGFSRTDLGDIAFVWDQFHGMRNLKDALFSDYGLDLSGWTLQGAYGISIDGRTIVGTGINPLGQREAWVVTIPEPTSLGLALLAWAVFLSRQCKFKARMINLAVCRATSL
jgi:probable HAF family extracellular repeat protein